MDERVLTRDDMSEPPDNKTRGALRPPSLDDMEAIATSVIASLPEHLRPYTDGLVIRVSDWVDEDTERELSLQSPYELLGLYIGEPLADKSETTPRPDTDMVFLYRRAILDFWCETEDDLIDVVRHVLIHEIGHHFGFSDDDMERIERAV